MKKIITLFIFIVILVFSSVIYATTSFTAELTCNKEVVSSGDEIEVKLKLKDFTQGERGIDVLLGTLSYDESVFETVGQGDIQPVEYWGAPLLNSENGKVIFSSDNFVSDNHDAFRIKLKVKDSVGLAGKAKISFTDISASDGESDIYTDNAVLTVKVNNPVRNILIASIIVVVILAIIVCTVFVIKKKKATA